jgi:hypothetical protein
MMDEWMIDKFLLDLDEWMMDDGWIDSGCMMDERWMNGG